MIATDIAMYSSARPPLSVVLGVCVLGIAGGPAWSQEGAAGVSGYRPLIERYCSGCHNDRMRTAGVTLSSTPQQDAAVWEKVVRKLRTRQMPPPGSPKPDESAYRAVTGSLETLLDRAAAARPDPGRTDTFRRLNRTEYRNAVRDLLGLDVDFSSLLPVDETSQGFDNITVGALSPTLLEKYLAAAQKISRLAIGSPLRSPGGDTILIPPDLTQEESLAGLPFGTRGGASIHYNFPLDGEYEFQLRLSRDRDERVEGLTTDSHEIELALDGARVKTFTVKPPPRGEPHHLIDKDLNLRLAVRAGEHEVTAAFLKRSAALLETERQPYAARFNADRHPRSQPALYSVSIVGPYDPRGPGETESRRRIFVCSPVKGEEERCAQQILEKLLRRAYRRQVKAADLAVPLEFYRDARARGSFDDGIEMALRALLVSPQFLFRIERDPAGIASGTAYRLPDVELASRLSFFLWSSIPDEVLLDAAIRGELRRPGALEKQVRRMLNEPRSRSLVTNFAAQWLYLRNLESTSPDPRLFPDFDENLRQALRLETELFFESILKDDRSVLDLLRADYTFLNERLAKHYGVPHVYGSHFRRVALGSHGTRGGLLSHGSILTVTSYATRTSPVIRGKWILTNILGAPPSPPPPNVPPLKEKGAQGKALTIRAQMAAHRDNPACASCHNLMDPVGFALENFDAVGRWRSEDGTQPVDAAGSFPDGTRFEGAAGLQQAVLSRPELFVGALTEKLLTYALGRGIEPSDAPAIRKVIAAARPNEFRFSSLIAGIVSSTSFQMRRSQ